MDRNKKKKRGNRPLIWFPLSGTALIAIVAFVGFAATGGLRISAPDWLRIQLMERVNSAIKEIDISVGNMRLVLDEAIVPYVELSEVTITGRSNEPIAVLSNVSTTMSWPALIRGRLHPNSITFRGAHFRFRRNRDGKFGIFIGEQSTGEDGAIPEFADVMVQIDGLLQNLAANGTRGINAEDISMDFIDDRTNLAWEMDNGRLKLGHEDGRSKFNGYFAVTGEEFESTTVEFNYSSPVEGNEATIGIVMTNMPSSEISDQFPALAWMKPLDAPLSGSLRASVDSGISIGSFSARINFGAGVLQPEENAKPIPFNSARSYFSYNSDNQVVIFDEVAVDSKYFKTSGSGKFYLIGMEKGWPDEIQAQIKLNGITINRSDIYANTVELENASMDLKLNIDPFTVTLGELSIVDSGEIMVMNGAVGTRDEGWSVKLDGRMSGIAPDRMLYLWPRGFISNAKKWISRNVKRADLDNIQFSLRWRPEQKPDIYLSFDYGNLDVRAIKAFPIVEQASGHAELLDRRFVISADKGHVNAGAGGRVDIAGTSFVISDTDLKFPPSRVNLATSSNVTAALSLLDSEPLNLLKKAGFATSLATGYAKVRGDLDFVLRKSMFFEDVAFSVESSLSDVVSNGIVKDKVVSARHLNLKVDTSSISIAGKGQIGMIPFEGEWSMPVKDNRDGASRFEGWVELSPKFVEEFDIELDPVEISGRGRSWIHIDMRDRENALFVLSSNLEGLGINIPSINWFHPEKSTGSLQIEGGFGQALSIGGIALDTSDFKARGSIGLNGDGELERAVFTRLQAGNWLDVSMEILGRGKDAAPLVNVLGGQIDLRKASLEQSGEIKGAGGPVSLSLDRLVVADSIVLTGFTAELDLSNGLNGTFAARVNGGGSITGRVLPQDGRSALHIQSDNAGRAISSAGLLKKAEDGKMDLLLTPGKGPGTYNGTLKVANIRLRDAPAMASLLNAISIIGILEQFAGEGIHFAQVDAKFSLSPEHVTLHSGSARGASLGITMEGDYSLADRYMDMNGVVSPIFFINSVGGIFSRQGEGLIGFNYSLEGPSSNPKVQVNPLSALTPGIFRRIFPNN